MLNPAFIPDEYRYAHCSAINLERPIEVNPNDRGMTERAAMTEDASPLRVCLAWVFSLD
jgi:hypothetical protein